MASLLGWFIADAAPRSRKKSIAPHATTLRPYTVMRKPVGVVPNFHAAVKPWRVASTQLCFSSDAAYSANV
jgi:hypothetical protein